MNPSTLIATAIEDLRDLLEQRLQNKRFSKSASLLAYWIRDYVRLLKKEHAPNKNYRRYERGAIVKVHLGFRIGNEEGGLHYGIVLDRRDGIKNPVLTILPMTSVKPTTDLNHLNFKSVYLGNEVTDAIAAKLKESALDRMEEAVDASEKLSDLKEHGATAKDIERWKRDTGSIPERIDILRNQIAQAAKMKRGGIALCNQIVTVSKLRIYDPCSSNDLLYGIRLSAESLDKIDEKIKELYLNH